MICNGKSERETKRKENKEQKEKIAKFYRKAMEHKQ